MNKNLRDLAKRTSNPDVEMPLIEVAMSQDMLNISSELIFEFGLTSKKQDSNHDRLMMGVIVYVDMKIQGKELIITDYEHKGAFKESLVAKIEKINGIGKVAVTSELRPFDQARVYTLDYSEIK